MRIAFVARSLANPTETFIRDLAEGLAARNELRVFCAKGLLDTLDVEKVPFAIERPNRRRDWVLERLLGQDRGVRSFRRREAAVLRHLAPAVREYSPDVIYCDYGTIAETLFRMSRRLGVPLVFHFHGHDASFQMNYERYRKHMTSMLASGVPFVVPSQHVARLVRIACATDAAVVSPCGPNLTRIRMMPESTKTSYPTVIAVGRLVAKKNPLALVEAFHRVRRRVPRARLTIVGTGVELSRVRERISKLAMADSITLCGALPHGRVLELIAQSWVLAQHSVTAPNGDQEGLPVAILEAMALSVPVVSTLHSGIPEAVIDGQTGYLVREHDYESMAARIVELLNDGRLRRIFGERGAEEAQRYSLERRVSAVEGVLRSSIQTGIPQ